MRRHFIIFLWAILFCGCNRATTQTDEPFCVREEATYFYDSLANVCSHLISEFNCNQDSLLLDSVLSIIDANHCDSIYPYFYWAKATVYSLKKDYYSGLACIMAAPDLVDPEGTSKYCDILHFKAMIAQHEGSIDLRDSLVRDILDTLTTFIPALEEDSVCRLNSANKLVGYPKSFFLLRLYYYRIQVYGIDKVQQEFTEKYPDFDHPDVIFGYVPDFMVFEMY